MDRAASRRTDRGGTRLPPGQHAVRAARRTSAASPGRRAGGAFTARRRRCGRRAVGQRAGAGAADGRARREGRRRGIGAARGEPGPGTPAFRCRVPARAGCRQPRRAAQHGRDAVLRPARPSGHRHIGGFQRGWAPSRHDGRGSRRPALRHRQALGAADPERPQRFRHLLGVPAGRRVPGDRQRRRNGPALGPERPHADSTFAAQRRGVGGLQPGRPVAGHRGRRPCRTALGRLGSRSPRRLGHLPRSDGDRVRPARSRARTAPRTCGTSATRGGRWHWRTSTRA